MLLRPLFSGTNSTNGPALTPCRPHVRRDGASFWRDVFDRVSLEKLDELAAGYRHTAEETADLCKHYTACKGDLGKVMDLMIFSTAEDEPRFRETLQSLIDAGQLLPYRAFTAEPAAKKRARDRKAAREAREAEESALELGLRSQPGDLGALRSALALRDATRKSDFGNMLESLEDRFGGKDGKAAKQKNKAHGGASRAPAAPEDPLSDKAFAAAQARMLEKCKRVR